MSDTSTSFALTVGPNEPDNAKFGQILEDIRRSIPFSRSAAATRMGVSSEFVRAIERGTRIPAQDTFLKMLEVYGIQCHRNKSLVIFRNISVEFTSRIKERRNGSLPVVFNRDELLGQIVSSLIGADDDTLKKVHKILH